MSTPKNRYRELLDLFTSDNERLPKLCKPFIQEGYAIASDAVSLICFDKKLLGEIDFTSHPDAPDALKVIPDGCDEEVLIPTELLHQAIQASRALYKQSFDKVVKPCPDCDGSGMVDYHFTTHKGKRHELESECPTCDSEGQIETYFDILNAEPLDREPVELMRFRSDIYHAWQLERLWLVAAPLGVDTIRLQLVRSSTAKKFLIGDVTVLVMPCSAGDVPCTSYNFHLPEKAAV